MSETDERFIDRMEHDWVHDIVPNSDDAHRLFALARRGADAADEIEKLRAALEAWNHAVRIDVLMEGPRYMGVSGEAGKRAWEMTCAALGGRDE